jgi:hypothetical protein
MKTAQLLILIVLFLVAILIHWLLMKKESFIVPEKTILNARNVQQLVDDFVSDLLAGYQKLVKDTSIASDPRIRYRLIDIGYLINQINTEYPGIMNRVATYDYSTVSKIGLEDLRLIKDMLVKKVGIHQGAILTVPADLADLDMLSNRIRSIQAFIQQKALMILNSSGILGTFNTYVNTTLQNLRKLKADYGSMSQNDIPLLACDLYWYAILRSNANFLDDPTVSTKEIPNLEINNLPGTKSTTSLFGNVTTNLSDTPSTTSTSNKSAVASTSTGMKFSELVQSLISYYPRNSYNTIPTMPTSQSILSNISNTDGDYTKILVDTTRDLVNTTKDYVKSSQNRPPYRRRNPRQYNDSLYNNEEDEFAEAEAEAAAEIEAELEAEAEAEAEIEAEIEAEAEAEAEADIEESTLDDIISNKKKLTKNKIKQKIKEKIEKPLLDDTLVMSSGEVIPIVTKKTKLDSPASIGDIKKLIHNEISPLLSQIKHGPKDMYNSNLVSRSVSNPSTKGNIYNSNSLEQGSWYRNAKTNPYAASQNVKQNKSMYGTTKSNYNNLADTSDYVSNDTSSGCASNDTSSGCASNDTSGGCASKDTSGGCASKDTSGGRTSKDTCNE